LRRFHKVTLNGDLEEIKIHHLIRWGSLQVSRRDSNMVFWSCYPQPSWLWCWKGFYLEEMFYLSFRSTHQLDQVTKNIW